MKHLPAVGVVVAVLALFLSSAALVAGAGGGDDVTGELAKLNNTLATLDGRVAALKADLAAVSEASPDVSTTLSGLRARIKKTEAEAARVGEAVAGLPDKLADDPAAAGGALDPAKLREIVRAEVTTAREEWTRAQGDRTRRDMTARIREGFGLTEEKAAKVAEVQRKAFGEMGRVWRENRDDRDAMRKAMGGLWDKAEKEMAGFLTEDELGKVREWREQMEQRMRGRGDRGNRGGGRDRPQPREEPRPQDGDDPAPF